MSRATVLVVLTLACVMTSGASVGALVHARQHRRRAAALLGLLGLGATACMYAAAWAIAGLPRPVAALIAGLGVFPVHMAVTHWKPETHDDQD